MVFLSIAKNWFAMKNLQYKLLLTVLLFSISTVLLAQEENKLNSNKSADDTYFTVELHYISDAIFLGRKDSISSPYLYPSLLYQHKSGFYAKGSLSYLTKEHENRIDLFLISAGFDFNINDFYADISATKYFFSDDSYNVISEVEADITANILYDFTFLNLGIGASVYFNNGDKTDFILSSELSHDFITNNYKFQISPTFGVYLGSQNFYQEYFVNNRFVKGSGSGGNGSGNGTSETPVVESVTTVNVQESEKFTLMAVEFSLPMFYIENAFKFSFLPTLVLPQNEANLVVDGNIVKESLDESFYWIFGISYNF